MAPGNEESFVLKKKKTHVGAGGAVGRELPNYDIRVTPPTMDENMQEAINTLMRKSATILPNREAVDELEED